ncbi:hypothetical protein KGY77_08525 [Candidatus Bipolaricaulota bacterium]|nr:hypothetical protein [Candidatus Bipolaricaulota bacterium]
MKKIAVTLTVILLIFGASVIAEEEVKVPFSAVKSSCYGQIDMSKAEFLLSEIGKDCVKDSWLEENLSKREDKQNEDAGKITVWVDESIEPTENETVEISGTTNLMDGSILFYSIRNEDNPSILDLEGEMVVSGGNFEKEVDITDMGEGEISVLVGFHPFSQSEKVREKYGDWGGNIEGDQVEFVKQDVKGADGYNRLWVEETTFDIQAGVIEKTSETEEKKTNEISKLKEDIKQILYDEMGETVNWGDNQKTFKGMDLIKQFGYEKDVYLAKISYRINDNFTKGMIRGGMIGDAMDFFQKLYNNPQVTSVVECMLMPEFKMVDQYGNESEEQVAKIVVSRDLAEKINWENMYRDRFVDLVKDEGGFWLHTAIRE